MRTLLLVCFAASLLGQSSEPPRGGKQKVAAQQQQAVSQNGSPELTQTSICTAAPTQPPSNADGRKGDSRAESPWRKYLSEAFAPAYLSNWALSLFAVVAAYVGLKTLGAIKQQGRIARVGLRASRIAASASTVAAKAAKESADTASRALLLTERADILIEAVPISNHPVFDAASVISIAFKNFGRTRANQVQVRNELLITGVALAGPFQRPLSVAVLAAGQTLEPHFHRIGEWITAETARNILDGKAVLRFEAEVFYVDVFGQPHRTKGSGAFVPQTCSFRIDTNMEAD